jgi:hypothetical protein
MELAFSAQLQTGKMQQSATTTATKGTNVIMNSPLGGFLVERLRGRINIIQNVRIASEISQMLKRGSP